jgi:hypothetical protein
MEYLFLDASSGFLAVISVLNFFLIFILLLMSAANKNKIKKLKIKYTKFMSGASDQNMEQLLGTCLERVNDVENKIKATEFHLDQINTELMFSLQKVGVVRFNAFDNVGSDLSFSIALLDRNDSGIVFSGIYSRENSATYAKPVVNGKSKYALSAEEIQAIDIAIKSAREKQYTKQ